MGDKPTVGGPRGPSGDGESQHDVPVETVEAGEASVAKVSVLLSFLGGVSKSTCLRALFVAPGAVMLMGASGVTYEVKRKIYFGRYCECPGIKRIFDYLRGGVVASQGDPRHSLDNQESC